MSDSSVDSLHISPLTELIFLFGSIFFSMHSRLVRIVAVSCLLLLLPLKVDVTAFDTDEKVLSTSPSLSCDVTIFQKYVYKLISDSEMY